MTKNTKLGGIKAVTHGDVDLREPREPSPGQVERYGVCQSLQIGPTTAAMFCNRRTIGAGHWDYEDGNDVLIFNDLSALAGMPATIVNRNEQERDKKTGRTRVIVKYEVSPAFVPLGALNSSGSAHPHAGTGFAISETYSFLTDDTGYYDWRQASIRRLELRQYSYDGAALHVDHLSIWDEANPLRIGESEWNVFDATLCIPIPDGDDLLMPLIGRRANALICGVGRWRREAGRWRPVAFCPVATGAAEEGAARSAEDETLCDIPQHAGTEPTLVRDLDGSLLFAVRIERTGLCGVYIWRSSDQGRTWTKVIDLPKGCDQSPVTLNRAADGAPYVTGNLYDGTFRAKLCLWPLNDTRNGLLKPLMVRDCVKDFGPPPEDARWHADHPVSSILRLADGKLHGTLGYRVLAFSVKGRGKEIITPATGFYLEEVQSKGRPVPIWQWQD